MRKLPANQGFTLVELSMVMVVIGLLSGGILLGRDLIRAAQVRSLVEQIRAFDTAVNAFRTKYDCLPGDCPNAEEFLLGQAAGPGANGNGDGKLNGGEGDYTKPEAIYTLVQPELINFWHHMSKAHLIAGEYSGYTGERLYIPGVDTPALKLKGSGLANTPTNGGNPMGGVMVIPLDRSNNSGVHSDAFGNMIPALVQNKQHSWYLTAASGYTNNGGLYSGEILYAIDSKLDDGLPTSGNVVALIWNLGQLHNPGYVLLVNAANACINRNTNPFSYRVNYVAPPTYFNDSHSRCTMLVGTSF